MNTCQIADQIKMAGSITELDQHAKAIWRQFGEGHIEEQEAIHLDQEARTKRAIINSTQLNIRQKAVISAEEEAPLSEAIGRYKNGMMSKQNQEQFCRQVLSNDKSSEHIEIKRVSPFEGLAKKPVSHIRCIDSSINSDADRAGAGIKPERSTDKPLNIEKTAKPRKPRATKAEKKAQQRALKSAKDKRRTCARGGITRPELSRISEAGQIMDRTGLKVYMITYAPYLPDEHFYQNRRYLLDVIVKAQKRANCPQFAFGYNEIKPDTLNSLHIHVLALFDGTEAEAQLRMIENLFLAVGDALHIQPFSSAMDGVAYATEFRVTQASYIRGAKMRPRQNGCFELGEYGNRVHIGGGDRDYISTALKAEIKKIGRWEPYKRTYRARIPKAPQNASEAPQRHFVDLPISSTSDLFGGLPEVTARPKNDVLSGKPISKHRSKIMRENELPLVLLPDARDLIKLVGSSDRERAEKLGVSRAQVTNIKNGQFGSSKTIVKKLLELTKLAA